MDTQIVKTTIMIDAELLYLAKMKALKEKKSLKEIINESLAKELGRQEKKREKTQNIKIGGYKLGGIKGGLRRIDIYENF